MAREPEKIGAVEVVERTTLPNGWSHVLLKDAVQLTPIEPQSPEVAVAIERFKEIEESGTQKRRKRQGAAKLMPEEGLLVPLSDTGVEYTHEQPLDNEDLS